jgi:polysaccharide export outer membrane protein
MACSSTELIMKFLNVAVLLSLVLVFTGCALDKAVFETSQAPVVEEETRQSVDGFFDGVSNQVNTKGYSIRQQDVLNITVFDEDNLSGEYTVDTEGNISMPLIGKIAVADKNLLEAEQAIQNAYKEDYILNPIVEIKMDRYNPFYIMGEIKEPGSYEFQPGLNALKAVALAGGFTYRANQKLFKVYNEKDDFKVSREVPPNYKLIPGDVLVVKERFF